MNLKCFLAAEKNKMQPAKIIVPATSYVELLRAWSTKIAIHGR